MAPLENGSANRCMGSIGQDFISRDGVSFMVVTLTGRHFRDVVELTDTAKSVAALSESLNSDLTDEGERYRHRDALTTRHHRQRRIKRRSNPARRCHKDGTAVIVWILRPCSAVGSFGTTALHWRIPSRSSGPAEPHPPEVP